LQPCVPPVVYRSETVRDLSTNSVNRDFAYKECSQRMACVIAWYEGSEKGECGKYVSTP